MLKTMTASIRQLTLATPLLALVITSVFASEDDHDRAQRLVESGDIVPLEHLIEHARRLHPGRILEVELENKRGRRIYEIELIDSAGIVWEMKFDAQTGELLKTERED